MQRNYLFALTTLPGLFYCLITLPAMAQSVGPDATTSPPTHMYVNSSSTAWWITQLGLGGAGEFQINNTSNSNPALIGITNGSGYGVYGQSSGTGVMGYNTTGTYGFLASGGYGVFGWSNSGFAVRGESNSGMGIYGQSGSYNGVSGGSTSGTGVYGTSKASSGAAGVWGSDVNGIGVLGNGLNGVQGYCSSAGYVGTVGAMYSPDYTVDGAGVLGIHYISGIPDCSGSLGYLDTSGTPFGIYAAANGLSGSGGAYAGYFDGNVFVNGEFDVAGAKHFKIDHPLDPANKYLVHSCVESDEMKNIYDGTVTTDANGNARITLPDWFEALNKDFRYQLTVIGQFAQAIVATKIHNSSFTIKTDKPNVEVCWQVTGVRQDAYARAHPMLVEQDKPANERGKYLHSAELGMPENLGIDYVRRQAIAHQVRRP